MYSIFDYRKGAYMQNSNTPRTSRTVSSLAIAGALSFTLAVLPSAAPLAQAFAETSAEHEAEADRLAESAAQKQAEADEIMNNIDTLQTQLNEANAEYERASSAHDEAEAAAKDAAARVSAAEKRIAELQVHLSDRAVSLYKTGGYMSYIEVILSATSFKEFATTLDSMERVINQDQDLVQESKDVRAEAQAAREEFETQQAKAAQEMAAAEQAKKDYEAAQASMQEQLDKVNEDIMALQVREEEERMEADAAKKREEEAARLAAQTKIQNSGYSASPTYPGTITDIGLNHPLPGSYVSSEFGWRAWSGTFHTGIDLAASSGTPIYACAAGTVQYVGWYGGGGQTVIVNHGNGVRTMYEHMSAYAVSQGEQVGAGDVVGYVGSTGNSTGPHLHLNVEINGTCVNPRNFIAF